MSENDDDDGSLEVARITIVRRVSEDDDGVYTTWDTDSALIELLGMVEFARDTILRTHRDDVTQVDEDDD